MPVSSGEPLRIKASDWNDVLSMVRDWKGVKSSSPTGVSLPCVTANLSQSYGDYRRPVWGEVVSLYITGYVLEDVITATLPLSDSWEPSTREKALFRVPRCDFQLLHPRPWTTQQTSDLHQPFAVCIDPRAMKFAISGMAIVRVRFHSKWHRFVRRPIALPGEATQSIPDASRSEYTGTLDSSGSGPGQIVGVFSYSSAEGYPPTLMDDVPWTFVNTETPRPLVWALIRW
jgi:hypothetical protein